MSFRHGLTSIRRDLTVGTITLVGALSLMLLGVMYIVYLTLPSGGYGTLPGHFLVAMTLGVLFTLMVGVGLMALVFYSNRKGYDEPPSFRN